MTRVRQLLQSSVLLLLAALQLALAHGHEDLDKASKMEDHDRPMTMADMEDFFDKPSYWDHTEHVGVMYAHIALMILSWVMILPLAVAFSIARSRLTLPLQVVFLVVNGFGILAGLIYNGFTPDLYEGNIHHSAGWAISCIALAWTLLSVFAVYLTPAASGKSASFLTVTRKNMEEHQLLHQPADRRWSSDSGQGTERNTDSLASSSRTPSMNSDTNLPARKTYYQDEDDEAAGLPQKPGFLRSKTGSGVLARYALRLASPRASKVVNFIYVLLERWMPLLAFLLLMSGVVTWSGVFREKHIFNGMAHFVKGGIFFWYGLLTFGRWMGCFADFGWAWNVKPGREIVGRARARIPSAEFTESFVIFLYGASNVFLEHLAAWGGRWTAMDLEHISITIMFFGGGLMGMLIESSQVRKCLLNTVFDADESEKDIPQEYQKPDSYVHSLNPVPGIVILLLGIMMSNHTQHSMVSGVIHKQWGTLFVGFALARAITYMTLWLKPPTTYLPARPPSEIVASFCLVSGGMIFMASNKDTVHALEQYKLDAMFVFTVMMGLTALIMAWELFVMAAKGWAVRREMKRQRPIPSRKTTA